MAVLPTNFKSGDPLNHDVVNDAFGQVNTNVVSIANVNSSINTTNSTLATTQTVANKNQTDLGTANQTIATQAAAITTLQQGLTAAQQRLTVLETATPPPAVPGKPTGLTAGTITTTSVVLSWTAPTGTAATGYQTQRAPAGTGTWTNGPATTAPTVTATVTGLTQGTSYDFRVVASNAAGPGGISDPITRSTLASFTPSPAWTEIPTVSTIVMDDGGLVTVTNGIIYLNGSPMGVSSQVIRVVKSNTGRIYQENANLDWWYWDPTQTDPWVFTSDPRPTQPASGVPPQSSAAGYNTLVFNSDFDSPGEIADFGGSGSALWWTGSPDGSYGFGTGNMSIANSILSINQSTGSASSLSTARAFGVPTLVPGSRPSSTGNGFGFRYGYYEAKMRFNSSIQGGTGWPSWWATCFHNLAQDQLEIDFMENQGNNTFNNGFLNWFNPPNSQGNFGDFFGALGADGYPSNWPSLVSQAGLDLNGGWNVFGCLWTPTRMSFWWNSWARRQQGIADLKVDEFLTSVPINGVISNDFGRPFHGTIAGANNGNALFLIIAGNSGKNVQFDWVHVYQ